MRRQEKPKTTTGRDPILSAGEKTANLLETDSARRVFKSVVIPRIAGRFLRDTRCDKYAFTTLLGRSGSLTDRAERESHNGSFSRIRRSRIGLMGADTYGRTCPFRGIAKKKTNS